MTRVRLHRRIAVIVMFLAAAVGAAARAATAHAADGLAGGGSWHTVAVTAPPAPSGERDGAIELGVIIAPAPTKSPTATPSTSTTPRPTSPTPAPGDGGSLPRTGVALGVFLALGAVLVGVGASLRLAARRRWDAAAD